MKSYDTAEYAGTRLIGTMILYKGVPVQVGNCEDKANGIRITATNVETGAMVQDYLQNFDMTPPPLGYVNYGKGSIYLSRMPMRKDWKQGFRQNNLTSTNGMVELNMKSLSDTIQGKFPSIKEIISKIVKGGFDKKGINGSIAFDRNFAIHYNGVVWYKGLFSIGTVSFETGAIKIDPAFDWVRESLAEVVGEVA